MARYPVEQFARQIPSERVASVRAASVAKTEARKIALAAAFANPGAARAEAARIKDCVLDNLSDLLIQFDEKATANGMVVHWATDAARAREIILGICRTSLPSHEGAGCLVPAAVGTNQPTPSAQGEIILKAKSMATEEIHLNEALEQAGFAPVETDLGEFVVQLDHDTPSHIVTPIIHKSKQEVARTFEREHIGPYTEDPNELTMQARAALREKFQQAKIGISGVNFAIAETGRIVLVENEGNNRFSTTAPDVHIALMGIEKLLPRERDLPLFLKLLAGSATGQKLTTYTHLITGPRREDEPDGPREVHVVLLDNGRSRVLNGPYREILRCIRCGACLNVCPVYRQASGHAYGHVYSGPLGAVLAPALEGVRDRGALAKASSLCGACEEVCPVQIPLPTMLLQLRDESFRTGVYDEPPWKLFAEAARSTFKWKGALKLLPMASALPNPLKSAWTEFRSFPNSRGRDFRVWWRQHASESGYKLRQSMGEDHD
jgi:L-lactate dehydrogenase complex protein LldF